MKKMLFLLIFISNCIAVAQDATTVKSRGSFESDGGFDGKFKYKAGAASDAATRKAAGAAEGAAGAAESVEEGAGVGLPEVKASIVSSTKTIIANAKSVINVNEAAFTEALSKYEGSVDSCVSRQSMASSLCMEQTSPHLQETLQGINTLVSGISSAAVSDSCSDFAKVMDLAKLGLTAYTTACGAARAACELSCSSAKEGLTQLQKLAGSSVPACMDAGSSFCEPAREAIVTALGTLKSNIPKELAEADPRSVGKKSSQCTYKYAQLIASSTAGIISSIHTIGQANKCKEESAGTTAETVPTDLAVKCQMTEYKETVECKCYENPRLSGCSNSLEKAGQNTSNGEFGSDGSTDRQTASAGNPVISGDGLDNPSAGGSGEGSSPMAGAPVGGGSAGIGGGGGGGGGASGQSAGGAGKGLNTDILSGSGGGGGGGSWGARFGSSSDDSKYRSYLPGGANDPNLAGGATSKEVTGQGGKSNWEKVRDRYRDNNSTLLNN